MTDYGFVPGGSDEFLDRWRTLLDGLMGGGGRPRTELLPDQGSVSDLVNRVLPTKPFLEDLIIVGHGLSHCQLLLDPGTPGSSIFMTYDDVETAIANRSFQIPKSVRTDATGNIKPMTVHLKACAMGSNLNSPMLAKLREAFGDKVSIVAPRHENNIQQRASQSASRDAHGNWIDPPPDVWFEICLYNFEIHAIEPFRKEEKDKDGSILLDRAGKPIVVDDLDGVIEAFKAQNFKLMNDAVVPDDYWRKWITHIPEMNTPFISDVALNLPNDWGVYINGTNNRKDVFEEAHWIWFQEEKPGKPFPVRMGSGPPLNTSTLEQRRDFVRQHKATFLLKDEFNVDWPLYRRFGCQSIDDFMESFDWLPDANDPQNWFPRRYSYSVWWPIVDEREPDPKKRAVCGILYRTGRPPNDTHMRQDDPFFFQHISPPP